MLSIKFDNRSDSFGETKAFERTKNIAEPFSAFAIVEMSSFLWVSHDGSHVFFWNMKLSIEADSFVACSSVEWVCSCEL